MTNRSILIFERKLTLMEVRRFKKIASAKSFRLFGRIDPDLLSIANKLLGKNISKNATAYQLENHGDLLFLLLTSPPPVLMYRADDLSQDIVESYQKFAFGYEIFLKYRVQNLSSDIEEHNKKLEALSILPHNESLKELVSTIEASVQQDISSVKAACAQYFASLAPL